MDTDTITEIVRIQLADFGIPLTPRYLNIAMDYYQRNNELPDTMYIINEAIPPEQNMEAELITQVHYHNDSYRDGSESESDDGEHSRHSNDDDSELPNLTHMPLPVPGFTAIQSAPNMPPMISLHDLLSMAIGNRMEDQLDQEDIDADQLTDVKKVLKESELDKIKLIMVKNLDDLEGNTECPNCYDTFVYSDLVRILPCGHYFHRLCIDKQLTTESHLCPICKKESGEHVFINI